MKLLLNAHYEALLRNGRLRLERAEAGEPEPDFLPVVKLFTPDGACTWLLTELDPEEPDIAFGFCDLGMGCPELGSVRLSELSTARGPLGLPIERDRHFRPSHTLMTYARAAWSAARINENPQALDAAAKEGAA